MRTLLSIAAFYTSEDLATLLETSLQGSHVQKQIFYEFSDFLQFITQAYPTLDCLIIEDCDQLKKIQDLRIRSILLPLLIIQTDPSLQADSKPAPQDGTVKSVDVLDVPLGPTQRLSSVAEQALSYWYHPAELTIYSNQLEQLEHWIDEAVKRFITLSSETHLIAQNLSSKTQSENSESSLQAQIASQQQRLADKLKERLGYLGVYYKRNPEVFLRYLSRDEQKEFLDHLKLEYRQVILNYFVADSNLNQKIDSFVHAAFFADVPVSKVVELHIGLMDEFAKQLKLEGRSEEILLDYRLALIDVLAHLCEMYRRSIPREA